MVRQILVVAVFITSLPLSFTFPSNLRAQIVPDATLPQPSTVSIEQTLQRISGGTQAGRNLFHSFDRFNVEVGETAYFDNTLSIDNIITRVTGGNLSTIDGLIRANGTANFFLLNPSGIVFGESARLDLGGSFFATTSDRIQFSDGQEFSASARGPLPLLSLDVPIGLQFGTHPGAIVNRATAEGLQVQSDRTLALIGGSVVLDGGHLSAPQGRIELASVPPSGSVGISPADPSDLTNGGNIELSGGATLNTTGLGGGAIRIRGGRVTLTQGSGAIADTLGEFDGAGIDIDVSQLQMSDRAFISASTFGTGSGGHITLRANAIDISGTEPGQRVRELASGTFDPLQLKDGIYALSLASGMGGNVVIEADRALLNQGTGIITASLVEGAGGNIAIRVADAQLMGGSLLLTGTAGLGDAGDLTLVADTLRILEGTVISTSPNSNSQGGGGDLTVRANTIELRGTPAGVAVPNGLFVTTLGLGAGGHLSITANRLIAADGSQLSASSSGAGTAGNLEVVAGEIELSGVSDDNLFLTGLYSSTSLLTVAGQRGTAAGGNVSVRANRLSVRDGAQISSATGNSRPAGNVDIEVAESITVSGFATDINPIVESVSFGIIGDGIVPSAIEANTRDSGAAGDVTLRTSKLTVTNGAEVGVRGTNTGAAGNLNVTAEAIVLDRVGSLSASTIAGNGGNLNIQTSDLQLRNGSRIITDANTQDGGNITIDTNTLVAFDNSDITANALQGRGGRVTINAQGIFGTQFQASLTPNSDITATSKLGPNFGGIVTLKTPDVQSSVGIIELDARQINPQTLVTVGCRDYQGSELIVTGRGGLPPDPTQPLNSDRPWQDMRFLDEVPSQSNFNPTRPQSVMGSPPPPQLVEATGWHINDRGQVELVAHRAHVLRSSLPECLRQSRGMGLE